MTVFWIVTAVLGIAVVALLLLALLRGQRDTGPAEAFDLSVYRDQLNEVERDQGRGVIAVEDAERLKTEISRRILAADAKARDTAVASGQPRGLGLAVGALMTVVILGGGYGLYTQLGAPGYGDLGLETRIEAAATARETRPGQSEAEAQIPATPEVDTASEYAELVVRLREAVSERPDDLQGHILLARSEAALGNYRAAYEAQEKIIALKADTASSKDYADLADMMVLAAGGYVSPEAEIALEAALQRDGQNGVARYYSGLMMAQIGRPDIALRVWDALLRDSAPDAPWIPPITAQIEELAFRAGFSDYEIPTRPNQPGPTAEDVEAAQELSADERQEMIRGMVNQLSDRLATEGGPPEDWARLISSLAVLGDEAQAIAVWNNAQEVFAANPQALDTVRSGARAAGLVP